MGDIVQLARYRRLCRQAKAAVPAMQSVACDALGRVRLVPVEWAVGEHEIRDCMRKLAAYDVRTIHLRKAKEQDAEPFYLITVEDALRFNRELLEREILSLDEQAWRVDLIQSLENLDYAPLDAGYKLQH